MVNSQRGLFWKFLGRFPGEQKVPGNWNRVLPGSLGPTSGGPNGTRGVPKLDLVSKGKPFNWWICPLNHSGLKGKIQHFTLLIFQGGGCLTPFKLLFPRKPHPSSLCLCLPFLHKLGEPSFFLGPTLLLVFSFKTPRLFFPPVVRTAGFKNIFF